MSMSFKPRLLSLFMAICMLITFPAFPVQALSITYRVTPNGITSGSCGGTWATACGLQYALSLASSDDVLWVAAGTYKPTTGSDRTVSFTLESGVAVYGGFAGTETVLGQRNPTTNVTILTGDLSGNDGPEFANRNDNSYHVVVASGVDNTTVLDGFTIKGGNSDGASGSSGYGDGSGMLNTNGSPQLTNLIFVDNRTGSYGHGGGLNNTGSPALKNVTFNANYGGVGGGMYNTGSPTLTDVTFNGNNSANGGGMNSTGASPTLTNVTFSNNTSYNWGGGMYTGGGNPILINVTFFLNEATNHGGGGMYIHEGTPTLTNVTIHSNSARVGGGIAVASATTTVRNTILWGNTARDSGMEYSGNLTISDSIISDGCHLPGSICTNIITADPILGALSDSGGFTLTIPLLPESSAINTGNDSDCPGFDQRGVQRPQGEHCDIGAYEAHLTPVAPGKAMLTSPTGNLMSNTPTYTWRAVNGSTFYYLQVDGPSGNVIKTWYSSEDAQCDETTCSVTPATPLSVGAHKWWIQTWNDVGYGPWSNRMDFSVTVPGKATLNVPTGSITDTTPEYTWNVVAGATRYYLYVNGPSGNVIQQWYDASVICNSSICTVIPITALSAGAHKWWIQTWSSAGEGPWSDVLNFTVDVSLPPSPQQATLTAPSGNITDTTSGYTWSAVEGATWYYLWVNGPAGNMIKQWFDASVVCTEGICSVTPDVPLKVGTHKWWIQTWNDGGYGPWSDTMNFTVAVPGKATLMAPASSITDPTPDYTWTAVEGATWYYLYVNGPSGNVIKQWYDAALICSGGTCTVAPTTTLGSGAHKWWVQTWSPVGYGAWSERADFSLPVP